MFTWKVVIGPLKLPSIVSFIVLCSDVSNFAKNIWDNSPTVSLQSFSALLIFKNKTSNISVNKWWINLRSWKLKVDRVQQSSLLNSSTRMAQLLLEEWPTLLHIFLCRQFCFAYYHRIGALHTSKSNPLLSIIFPFRVEVEDFLIVLLGQKERVRAHENWFPLPFVQADFNFNFKN